LTPSALPHNPSLAALSDGLAAAHRAYGSSKSDPQLPTCILFIVQPDEHNIFDQRLLSLRLTETNQIPTFRLPFPLVTAHTSIPPANPSRPLIYHPPHSPSTHYEVSTLYFRSAYTPTDYAHPTAWPSRLHLERSASIKCPSILTHLAGSKKVQQVLATPGAPHLDRFLPSAPDDAAGLARTFAAIYPLDSSPAGETAKALAMDPERAVRFVLKPQREGGGNNVYGRNIPGFLQGMGGEEGWKGHILMELIEPPVLTNSIFREGKVIAGEVVGELGVYGAVLWDHKGGKVLLNEEAGWLLRTKGRESEEGGVAAGFGCVDSVCLVGD
jgi:glutathione synthase